MSDSVTKWHEMQEDINWEVNNNLVTTPPIHNFLVKLKTIFKL